MGASGMPGRPPRAAGGRGATFAWLEGNAATAAGIAAPRAPTRRRARLLHRNCPMITIVRREAFSDTTFLWEVLAPDVARAARPGHFVMLRLHEHAERIPLTVADMDPKRGT